MRLLRHPQFLAVSIGHLCVDLLNSLTGVLLAAVSLALGLSNTQLGLIATAYALLGALSQPFFGWLADRHGGRWMTGAGILWMAVFFALFALTPGAAALAFLVLAALGSGAFHPGGTARAAQVGAVDLAGQAATAASVFFLFGQVGLSAGPALGGLLLEHTGKAGILGLAALAAPAGLFVLAVLRDPPAGGPRLAPSGSPRPAPQWGLFIVILLVSGLRLWAQTSVTTFAPKLFLDLNYAPSAAGGIVAAYMAGTALGGVLGSALADRWSYPRTVFITLALSTLPFAFLPLARGPWAFALAMGTGLLSGGPHSILVTMAQRALPGRAGLASGLILGLTFALGALGTSLTGWLADLTSLAQALQLNAGLSAAAAAVSLLLVLASRPNPQRAAAPSPD